MRLKSKGVWSRESGVWSFFCGAWVFLDFLEQVPTREECDPESRTRVAIQSRVP